MVTSLPVNDYTFEDYVALERSQGDGGVKHEFIGGEIVAMAGGTPRHALLGAEVVAQLRAQVRSPCRVFSSDLWLGGLETNLSTYADGSIVCGPLVKHPKDPNIVVNPSLVVEVTSKSSERKDRGAKLAHYRSMASVNSVVLVSHAGAHVEVHQRRNGTWTVSEATTGVLVVADGLAINVDALYAAAEDL